MEDHYVAYTWQVPRHKKYSILFNEPCSCKNRRYVYSDMRYSCWEGSVFIVCCSLRTNSFLKELFHLFNMNELCTLLNRSFPSFLQRVLPKGNAFCTKGNPYYFRKNVKRVMYIYIIYIYILEKSSIVLGGILCLPHRPHSFLKIKWNFAHILQGITYAFDKRTIT